MEELDNKNKDPEFYKELHSASRSYDVKLWAIPGFFFAVVGLIIGNVNLASFFDYKNLVILFFGVIFLTVLLGQFYKTHFFNLSIQKKIDNFDEEFGFYKNKLRRMPLESMNDTKLNLRIVELESEGHSFTFFQKFLIKQRITDWMKSAMLISWCFIALAFGICLFETIF